MKTAALGLALLLLAGTCLAEPADDCMARVLDGLNTATAAAYERGTPLSDAELRSHMGAWEACGGVNPYHLTTAARANIGGRRLLGKSNCAKLACFRNGITDGAVLCNAWCGLYAHCEAAKGSWGHCQYDG